jgi:IPT/TIG domain-containing protein
MTITRQPCDNRPVTIRHTCRKWGQQAGKYHRCSGICGTVFSLSVGLGPFVEAQSGSGKVGAKVGADVKILGTDLTGATGVRFNDTAAEFTVVSSSEITTTVPAGATTGEVEVVTPSGTLSSNVSFRVP